MSNLERLEGAWFHIVAHHYDVAMEAWRSVHPDEYDGELEYYDLLISRALDKIKSDVH